MYRDTCVIQADTDRVLEKIRYLDVQCCYGRVPRDTGTLCAVGRKAKRDGESQVKSLQVKSTEAS